jgi:hypothetical protein
MNFIDNIQTNPSLLLVELILKREGDVMDADAMEFINLIDYS